MPNMGMTPLSQSYTISLRRYAFRVLFPIYIVNPGIIIFGNRQIEGEFIPSSEISHYDCPIGEQAVGNSGLFDIRY